MRLRIPARLLFFAVCAEASANDLYAEINRMRAGEGNCAVADWIKSPPHCANLMNPVYTEMGAFAVNAKSEMGVYWMQVFGTLR